MTTASASNALTLEATGFLRDRLAVSQDACVTSSFQAEDVLLAKLAGWAERREQTTDRMIRALGEYDVGGIRTNLGFFRQILEDVEFRAGHLHTGFIEEFFLRHRPPHAPRELAAVAALAAALHAQSRANGGEPAVATGGASAWLQAGRGELLR